MLKTLEDALTERLTDLVRDAVIQCFEYVFELSWKAIQVAAEYVGSRCESPREAIKTAFKMKWLGDPEKWFEALEARNKTSHTYNVGIASEVYRVARRFPKLAGEVLDSLKQIE